MKFAAALAGALALSPAEKLFEDFVAMFERSYASPAERAERLAIFTENLEMIELVKATDSSAEYSHLTPFADWSVDEYTQRNSLEPLQNVVYDGEVLDTSDLPDSFDWQTKGAVNAVKNQQQCGSCWAFATVANIEGVNQIATGSLLSLSEQELVDCDKATGNQGCQGGLPTLAYKDMQQNKIGLELEKDYPYTAKDGKCSADKSKETVFIDSYKVVDGTDEDQLAAALIKYGPLAIGINATPMQWYSGGVANPIKLLCNPKKLDHGVAIVGFGVDGGKKYWTIRNSWGASWGEKGYYRIIRGTGACGVNTNVASAIIGKAADAAVVV